MKGDCFIFALMPTIQTKNLAISSKCYHCASVEDLQQLKQAEVLKTLVAYISPAVATAVVADVHVTF
jgi:hypothetical protein